MCSCPTSSRPRIPPACASHYPSRSSRGKRRRSNWSASSTCPTSRAASAIGTASHTSPTLSRFWPSATTPAGSPSPSCPGTSPGSTRPGVFTAAITLGEKETLATPAAVKSETPLGNGRQRIELEPFIGRDFAILCSERYKEFTTETRLPGGKTVPLRCLAFPEHEFYANEILKIVAEAIPVYSQWFGAFPYDRFTIAESFFGWNGNECAGLVMIDERVFGMPHLARGYVEYLVSHETCHQWWYNLVGTNGYCEPFMDEGAARHFTHRLLDQQARQEQPDARVAATA